MGKTGQDRIEGRDTAALRRQHGADEVEDAGGGDHWDECHEDLRVCS